MEQFRKPSGKSTVFRTVAACEEYNCTFVYRSLCFCEHNSDVIYMRYGEPMDIVCLEKDEALELLRDRMASMMYEMIIAHASPLSRSSSQETAISVTWKSAVRNICG